MIEHSLAQANEQVDRMVEEALVEDRTAGRSAPAMATICGVGEINAWTVIAYLGEIERVNRSRMVAIVAAMRKLPMHMQSILRKSELELS